MEVVLVGLRFKAKAASVGRRREDQSQDRGPRELPRLEVAERSKGNERAMGGKEHEAKRRKPLQGAGNKLRVQG